MTTQSRPPLWRDQRIINVAVQAVVAAVAFTIVAILVNNVRLNSASQGIPVNFDFLDQPSNFEIPANDFRQTQPVREALVQGVLNTLRVVIAGLVLATILGVLVGIGRLSQNFIVRAVCQVYVETLRNLPLLGIVTFAYLAMILSAFPRVENAWQFGSVFVASNRGIGVPWITGSMTVFLAVALLAGVAAWFVARWRRGVADRTGEPARDLLWSIPVFLLILFWGAVLSGNGITLPKLDGRQIDGGIVMQPEYSALLIALVLYTASHIAEIVRGSIQAVHKGQFEAASALALTNTQRMRFIILPQALRIAIPPFGNQYLNLMKNSSLGVVISYFELTKTTTTTVGNASPAVPAFLLTLLIYLGLSLTIAAFVNLANRRMAVADR